MAKPPRRITATSLDNIALYYLQRFSSSAENLRRVLLRRVDKAARAAEDGADDIRAQGAALVDALIERYRRSGLLDDTAYAEAKARTLHRRGASLKMIRQGLAVKGVDAEAAQASIERLRDDLPDADFAAAVALAKRRRLGPFRPDAQRADFRTNDVATLGRAGFAYDLARRVVDAESVEALKEMP